VLRAAGSGDGGRHAGNEGKCEGHHFTPGCAAARRLSKKTDSWILGFGSRCFLEPTAQDWDVHWRVEQGGVAKVAADDWDANWADQGVADPRDDLVGGREVLSTWL